MRLVKDQGLKFSMKARICGQRALRDVRWQRVAAIESPGERNRQQLKGGCADTNSADRVQLIDIACKLTCGRGKEGTRRGVRDQAHRGQLAEILHTKW